MGVSMLRAAALILLLAGCMATGKEVKESQLAQFHKGESTTADVLKALGTPSSSSLLNDGHRIFVYSYISSAARPESFIPVVGMFVGGADARMTVVSFTFNSSGILEAYSSTQTQTGTGTGFASGNTQERIADEPHAAPKN